MCFEVKFRNDNNNNNDVKKKNKKILTEENAAADAPNTFYNTRVMVLEVAVACTVCAVRIV